MLRPCAAPQLIARRTFLDFGHPGSRVRRVVQGDHPSGDQARSIRTGHSAAPGATRADATRVIEVVIAASGKAPGHAVSSSLCTVASQAALGSAGYCIETRSNHLAENGVRAAVAG